jgi:cytochrome c oxidase subunit I+III
MASGAPDQVIVLPRATYLPLWTALTTAGVVLAFLFKAYWLALGAGLVVAGLFVWGAQSAGLPRDYGPLPVGHGVRVPPHTEATGTPPWWGLVFTLIADGTLFTSLVFGTFYLWIAAPNWPPAVSPDTSLALALGCVIALVVAAAGARGSLSALAGGRAPQGRIGLAALALAGAIVAAVVLIAGIAPSPREHALGATAAALLGYVALHAGVGLLFLASNVLRIAAGRVSPQRLVDLRLTRLWLDYSAVTGAIAIGLVLALPALVATLGARP